MRPAFLKDNSSRDLSSQVFVDAQNMTYLTWKKWDGDWSILESLGLSSGGQRDRQVSSSWEWERKEGVEIGVWEMELLTEKVRWYDKRRLAGRTFWQDTWWFAITICKASLGIKIKIRMKMRIRWLSLLTTNERWLIIALAKISAYPVARSVKRFISVLCRYPYLWIIPILQIIDVKSPVCRNRFQQVI